MKARRVTGIRRVWIYIVACLASLILLSPLVFGQNVSASLKGTIVDPQNAAIPGALVTLTNTKTSATFHSTSETDGTFVFPVLAAGDYKLAIDAKGFKRYAISSVVLTPNEIRSLPRIKLSIGSTTQTVQVTGTAPVIQTATGQVSRTITGTQLNSLALKGRDFMALMQLVPGVVDTNAASREATGPSNLGGIYINGGRTQMKTFTVDGVTDEDTGNDNSFHYEPNMDSIAEVKILTSDYEAQYGKNADGLISVITKGGGQQFHGTAWEAFRNDALNANDFFRNREGLPKPPYRYNIFGYSLGGPVFIPHRFNTSRNKLFFFVSEEFTRTSVDYGTNLVNMPTAAERVGDFSQSFGTNGKLIPIIDPQTGKQFPGNIIPPDRINPLGQAILNFYPLPNYVDPNPKNRYLWNYKAAGTGNHNRRNDMVRIDASPTNKLHGYFHWINDHDDLVRPFWRDNFTFPEWNHPNPGHGYMGSATYIVSPRMVDDVSLGKSWNSWEWHPSDPAALERSAIGNIPQLFPNKLQIGSKAEQIESKFLPNIVFGGAPVHPPSFTPSSEQFLNYNNVWTVTDNLSYVAGSHQIKTGILYDDVEKVQGQDKQWNGVLNFARNKNNPYDSGDAFSNAILGNFNNYKESTADNVFDAIYWDLAYYVQDDWRVTRKLSLDYGVRFTHMPAQYDVNQTLAAFFPQDYNPAQAPLMYVPGLNSSGQRVGVDPATGQYVSSALIGEFVPGTGNTANGMKVGGEGGTPGGLYTAPSLLVAPRFGFAYDPTGKGTMVIRGGVGLFYDRSSQNISDTSANNPPIAYAPMAFYGNLDTFAQGSGVLGPTSIPTIAPQSAVDQPSTLSYSLGVQKILPFSSALKVSYVGNVSRHLVDERNLNEIPMFARFNPANLDPTTKNKPLPDNFLRPYLGWGNITLRQFAAQSNYNSLQVSLQHRLSHGLEFGASYTYSKALGIASKAGNTVSSYFDPRHRNYGPLTYDRTHIFSLNYLYDLPDLGRRLNSRFVGAITDHWALSGITTFVSGYPFTPTFGTTKALDITGSSEGAVINVIGNPTLSKSEKTFGHNFNTQAFALPTVGTFGDAGVGILRGPGVNNWDIALQKRIPLHSEKRSLSIRAEFYNAFNHTQFTNLDSTARFDPSTGEQVNSDFGAFTAAAPARVIAFTARISF